ncbi:MAG TPA: nucleotidyl transferase AbiEii/AbiGii toxin family protein [Chthoniobacteraceae bacterium]|nr:nucleotidyl transferase AbiEii/AbiGii toxin family protein [Chthoniobacteraceae bacterium]
MNELIEAAAELQRFCIERDWKFYFIGGLVVQEWAQPRFTRDVDITLLTGFGGEETYIEEFLRHYISRLPDAREFALRNRVLLLTAKSGVPIDIALGALPFEEAAVGRAREVEVYPNVKLRFCTPEDLIVMKAFAGRIQDWEDLRMTIVRQGAEKLDWKYILKNLELLLDGQQPDTFERLDKLREKYR